MKLPRGYTHTIAICITYEYQTLSNGNKMCLPKRIFTRKGLCGTTSRIWQIDFCNNVYKLQKALCGRKQAPRGWHEWLSKFLLEHGFERGQIDKSLFTKTKGHNFIIIQINVDDMLLGATNNSLGKEFSNLMSKEFKMSMMELTFFLDL